MTRARAILHIGTHKTGTTSLQHFLRTHDETLLAGVGACYPPGFLLRESHSELPLVAARPDRLWPARIRLPEVRRRTWVEAAAAHVRRVVASDAPLLVLSHEDLSYLREDDELDALAALLEGRHVQVVAYMREAPDFLRSYAEQLTAAGFELSEDTSSFAYVGADSWLVDRSSLLDAYGSRFGPSNVTAIPFEEAVGRDGSVIPSFTDLLGIERGALPDLSPFELNRSGATVRPSEEQLRALRQRILEQAP